MFNIVLNVFNSGGSPSHLFHQSQGSHDWEEVVAGPLLTIMPSPDVLG